MYAINASSSWWINGVHNLFYFIANTFKVKSIPTKLIREIAKQTLFLERGILSFSYKICSVKDIFVRIMDMSFVRSVKNEDRPKFKIVSLKRSDRNHNSTLSITPYNVVY